MVSYNLNDILEITSNMSEHKLDKDIQTIVDALIIILGLNVQSKAKTIKKDRNTGSGDKTWAKKEPFKVTVMGKNEGIDEKLDILRGSLNKITKNNYESQVESIYNCIDGIIDYNHDELDETVKYEKILGCIFKVVTNNRVYASIYSKLYAELLDKYILLEDYRSFFLDNYRDNLNEFDYVNPDDDYDKFCVINKINEQRKALLAFIIHSVMIDIYSFDVIKDTMKVLFEKINQYKIVKENVGINEEILENVFVIVDEGKPIIMKEVSKYEIIGQITEFSKLKMADCPGFSNRMRFKCMDIIDLYK